MRIKSPEKPPIPAAFSSLDNYLSTFAGAMASRVSEGLVPLFDPEKDALSPAVLALTAGDCPMKPYPAQAVCVEALMRLYEHGRRGERHKIANLIGEMGTGKTFMGAAMVRVMEAARRKGQNIVMTAPNQLVKKWKKHFEVMVPNCHVVIINDYRDLAQIRRASVEVVKMVRHKDGGVSRQVNRRWLRNQQTTIFILPRDRGKLGYSWAPAPTQRDEREFFENAEGDRVLQPVVRYRCPKCGQIQKDKLGQHLETSHFVGKNGNKKRRVCEAAPDLMVLGRKRGLARIKKEDGTVLNVCGEQLWQAFNGKPNPWRSQYISPPGVAPRRMAPCAYLRHLGVVFDLYIADELHELKGGATLQGQMFADLVNCSRRVLSLTGTLSGGYADNLLHILWRTHPQRLIADNLKHSDGGYEDFVKAYGVLQRQTRYVGSAGQTYGDLLCGRGKKSSTYVKSLPGISPVLFVNHLLDYSVFIRLLEMHEHLPPFTERVHTVQPTKEQDAILGKLQEDYKAHRDRHKGCRAWSGARAAFLRWPDKPWGDEFWVMDANEDERFPLFSVPSLPKQEYPKERRVRRLIKRAKLKGRKAFVFTELTGIDGNPAWDWMDYFVEYMGKLGFKGIVLRSEQAGGPKSADRDEWIAAHEPAVDFMMSHPALVRTGMDLYPFPSIIFAFPGDNTYNLRQASRRAWRLGQTQDCEVDYVVYGHGAKSKSVQEAALSLMGRKMMSSLAIEGDLSAEGLAAMSQSEDLSTQLARFIDGRLDDLDPARTSFEKYRAKLAAIMPNLQTTPAPKAPAPVVAPETTIEAVVEKYTAPRTEELPLWTPPPTSPTPSAPPAASPATPTPGAKKAPARAAVTRPATTRAPGSDAAVSVGERRRLRLAALSQVLGPISQSDGDRHRFACGWVHVVAKRRETVRDRNFEATAADYPEALIAFVEPPDARGPSTSDVTAMVDGIEYLVSMVTVRAYMAGERMGRLPPVDWRAEVTA